MRLRWKLLILLLVTAILPLLVTSLFARLGTQRMRADMVDEIGETLLDGAYRRLDLLSQHAVTSLERDSSIIETLADVQAESLTRLLSREDALAPGRVYFDSEFDDPEPTPPGLGLSNVHRQANADGEPVPMEVTYELTVVRLMTEQLVRTASADIAVVASMTDSFAFLRDQHPNLMLWQFVSTESGVHGSYPGHGGYPDSFDARTRPWYELARTVGHAVWSPPFIDVSTRQVILTRAVPVYRDDGTLFGVTGVDVPMLRVLDEVPLKPEWRDRARVLGARVVTDESTGARDLQVIFQRDYAEVEQSWDLPLALESLQSGDEETFARLLDDIEGGRPDIYRMPFEGRDSIWASGVLPGNPNLASVSRAALLIIVPFEEIVALAQRAESRMEDHIADQTRYTSVLIAVVIAAVALIALLGSQAVTRPIRALARAAERIAQGELDTRAEVSSRDELGELAESFNDMVPHLRDRLKLKESLELAMDVQQHLLPGAAPTVAGLDIDGRSVYCDETGGDYFDFLPLEETGSPRLGIVIGDVTGHGIAAALLMATARALVTIRAAQPGTLAEAMGDINRRLAADTPAGKFMTFYLLILDAARRSARWVSAGHDAAIVYDPKRNDFSELEGTDVPLGVDETWTFNEHAHEGFEPGQIVMLGTDGIWEARDVADAMYGKDRLRAVIRANVERPAAAISEAIIESVVNFRGARVQEDDITLIVVKFVERE